MKKRIFAGFLAVLIAAGGILSQNQFVKAAFDSSTAVNIKADDIEDSTLIIGTHLIYLQQLNDEIYQIAMDSASQSGQSQVYYKSELGGGNWFDISSASDLSSITEEGMKVDKAEIEALLMTHHTKSDGITYELRSNTAVCIFDISSTYEMEQMQELDAVKQNYDLLKESGKKSASDKQNIEILENFFNTDTHTSETDQYDAMIDALQSYYQNLSQKNADTSQKEVVLKIMGKLDAARKSEVCSIVSSSLETLLDELGGAAGEEEEDSDYEKNNALMTACGESQSSVLESQINYDGNKLSEGMTEMTALEYKTAVNLIAKAMQENYAECDASVEELKDLYQIMDGTSDSVSEEVINELIDASLDKYKESLGAGESAEYKQAKANQASHAELENILLEDAESASVLRNELQFYVSSKIDGMQAEKASEFVLECIKESADLYLEIKDDDLKEKLVSELNAYKSWLNQALENIAALGSENDALKELFEEKAKLQEERLSKLDKNQLDEAKQIEAKLQNIESKIKAEEQKLTEALTKLEEQKIDLEKQLQASSSQSAALLLAEVEAEIAQITASLSSESEAKNIMNMKAEAMSYIQANAASKSALSAIKNQIEGLAGFVEADSYLALAAEKSIYQALVSASYLQGIDEYKDLIERIETIVADNADLVLMNENGLSVDQALEFLDTILETEVSLIDFVSGAYGNGSQVNGSDKDDNDGNSGDSGSSGSGGNSGGSGSSGSEGNETTIGAVENLSNEEINDLVIAILALAEYGEETKNSELQKLAQGMAQKLANQYSTQVFETYVGAYGEYAPVDVLAMHLEYRYLWNDTMKTAILVDGKRYFSYTAFSKDVYRGEDKKDKMDTAAEFEGVVYLAAEYVKKEFDILVKKIPGTEYSVFINNDQEEKVRELVNDLYEKGGN